ncbi:cytochrome b561 and DOMON domain-containing protein [Prunus yedoensis var. nudiflora]|uniref:Cytochrome b561 and DOMON domain-containing protein n=1 Tax=Prunus yedoensis var. nudiflora TaxID=2094558 RepID=A0A314UWB8_PRUYE|nr:cytochrome b561 and DOMON domain-containing protein [Prunus yedoensis var. nudiflora]
MSQQACTPQAFNQKTFAACHNLPILNSTIHWNYYPSKGTVDVAFAQAVVSDSRWVAWAINPTSTGMVGSQAIVAFKRTDGAISVYSSPIKSYGTRLEQGNLSFPLFDVSAVYKNNQIVIFATIGLPNNVSIVNHVWQQGPLSGNTPQMHSVSGPNVQSFGTLDFLSGKVETVRRGTSTVFRVKISHGIINTISWGILMPVGALWRGISRLLIQHGFMFIGRVRCWDILVELLGLQPGFGSAINLQGLNMKDTDA